MNIVVFNSTPYRMGLFGHQKKRTTRVGIANENDLGSFVGMEMTIDKGQRDDDKKVFFQRGEKKETDREGEKKIEKQTEKRTGKRKEKPKRKIKSFFLYPQKDRKQVKPLHVNHQCPSKSQSCEGNGLHPSRSDELSVYTSSTNSKNIPTLRNNRGNGVHDTHGNCIQNANSDGGIAGPPSGGFVTLDHISDLILDLETAVKVDAKRPIRALKMLLALSSSTSTSSLAPSCPSSAKSIHDTRIDMVRAENERLVPVLLSYLNRCMVANKEHTLALLLFSNISIPQENKKIIALKYNGAKILAGLLCEDPSCYLVALVLVNLTYDSSPERSTNDIEVTASGTDGHRNKIDVINHDPDDVDHDVSGRSLRKELLAKNEDTALIESLAFALRVSSLTQDEYERRLNTIEECNYSEKYLSPSTRLSILMAKDQQLRSSEMEETIRRQRVLPATASADQILRQLRSDEQELQQWGSIDGTSIDIFRVMVRGTKNYNRGPSWSRAGAMSNKYTRTRRQMNPPPMVEKSRQIFPETAKWCLSALRNLTKPCNCDATAAHVLIKSGIFSMIVQYITTLDRRNAMRATPSMEESRPCPAANSGTYYPQQDNNFLSASYGMVRSKNAVSPSSIAGAAVNDGNMDEGQSLSLQPASNSPYLWESNSMQDAALSVVLNLSASSQSREYMNEPHTVKVLSIIAEYPKLIGRRRKIAESLSPEQHQTMKFQGLKARMALSYMIGSQGHFGQSKLRSSASTVQANRVDSSLVMSDSDIELLVELLANCISDRGKDGQGGGNYLSGTFDLKSVILSLRCLLTHTSNQQRIARMLGLELNSLLINELAKYSLDPSVSSGVDSESAGHIAFSLYLLSNHCFEGLPFLPRMYRPNPHRRAPKSLAVDHGLAANILDSYMRLPGIPPAGRHAAQQLLLRLEYLNFESYDSTPSANLHRTLKSIVRPEDLKINYILLTKIKQVQIIDRKNGSKPNPAIFHRSVLRCRKPCNWDNDQRIRQNIEWNKPSIVSNFENALIAVQQLSYGSIKARHSSSGMIDDIAIANKVARCASDDMVGGCYNFLWSWGDVKLNKERDGGTHTLLSPSKEIRSQRHEIVQSADSSVLGPSSYISSSDGNSSCDAGNELFSLIQLCCSSDSTDSETLET